MAVIMACERVSKRYPPVTAVDDVSFHIDEGEIFGLVGPNGAGKTTLIEMIEGLRLPDEGAITVLGLDPSGQTRELHERIGIQLQATSIPGNLKVGEAVRLFAGLYRHSLPDLDALLRTLALEDKVGTRYARLSGGQQQRVAIALALVNDPPVLYFDEISTGLDPQARRNTWEIIRSLRAQGKTVFLTTHYMEEAQELCDRVGVIDHGRIIALDTPAGLIAGLGAGMRISFRLDPPDPQMTAGALADLAAVSRVEEANGLVSLYTRDDNATLQALVRLADVRGFRLAELRSDRPTLDNVFLALTGKEMRA